MNLEFQLMRAGRALEAALGRHRRRVTAAVIVLLTGSAVTAFGVAPLVPDAAELPQRLVQQDLPGDAALQEQLLALDEHSLALYRSDLSRAGDTVDSLLKRLGVDDPEAARFLRTDPAGREVLAGRPGKMVQVLAEGGRMISLTLRSPSPLDERASTHFHRLEIKRLAGGGFTARTAEVPYAVQTRLSSGTIVSSLYAAADDAKLPDAVTNQLAELFGADIDFRRELRRGDTFSVLYEGLMADGEPVAWAQGAGRVLAARFENGGEVHEAIWFQEPGKRGAYFDPKGRSKNRMFLGSPLAFSRVTSGFAMRMHPISGRWSQHKGVDYGAPTGTPVRSVGEGVVSFAGRQNGYGNIVMIRHAGGHETRYAHLSRISVRQGSRVEQGQLIGAVGATGWATGPHLHFEFLVGGAQVDPVRMARASAPVTLSEAARASFAQSARSASLQLSAAAGAANQGERFE